MTFGLLIGAVEASNPLVIGAGVTTLSFAVVLVRVLLGSVTSQGGGWETLSHAQQTDAATARAETVTVREEMREQQRQHTIELATKDAAHATAIGVMGIEISDLKQQLRDRGPLP